jgi:hypothetical protein
MEYASSNKEAARSHAEAPDVVQSGPRGRKMQGSRHVVGMAVVGAVGLVVGFATGYLAHQPTNIQPQLPETTSVVASATTAALPPTAAPSAVTTAEPTPPPKQKAGTIVVSGNGPTLFGPYRFKQGGYDFTFEQTPGAGLDFNETSLVISLESRPLGYADPYQLLTNTSKLKGSNRVVVSGKLWIEVSSSANDFVLTFVPRVK